MMALSIHPEYVGDIAVGKKTNEYRTWTTAHRGDLLICCTATKTSKGFAALVVELYDVSMKDGVYAWAMRNVRPIKPFVVKGQQRLFEVEREPEVIPEDEDLINKIYDDFQEEAAK